MNYKLVKAEDGIVWVSLQPLLVDVKQALDNAMNIDTSGMDVDEKRGVDFTILAMESVHNFITSLLTEQNIKDLVAQADDQSKETLH